MRISDWSSDVCSSDLLVADRVQPVTGFDVADGIGHQRANLLVAEVSLPSVGGLVGAHRSSSMNVESCVRSACAPRDAWLLTAPRLVPMASAIWASERSR